MLIKNEAGLMQRKNIYILRIHFPSKLAKNSVHRKSKTYQVL